MEEGKPTGIKRGDINKRTPLRFEGIEGEELLFFEENVHRDGSVRLRLRDNSKGVWVIVHGYYGRGGEFFELEQERILD